MLFRFTLSLLHHKKHLHEQVLFLSESGESHPWLTRVARRRAGSLVEEVEGDNAEGAVVGVAAEAAVAGGRELALHHAEDDVALVRGRDLLIKPSHGEEVLAVRHDVHAREVGDKLQLAAVPRPKRRARVRALRVALEHGEMLPQHVAVGEEHIFMRRDAVGNAPRVPGEVEGIVPAVHGGDGPGMVLLSAVR